MILIPKKKKIKLVTLGQHYDLKQIYEEVEQAYFKKKLNLSITWFANANRGSQSSRLLGVYDARLKLIKIHRFLDNLRFPYFFLSYIVYHEMCHHVCPPKRGRWGRRRVHHDKFRDREKQFHAYEEARKFEKENLDMILDRVISKECAKV